MRVASLLPAATEMVCALGREDSLVGVSHECDFPRSVIGKPVLTSTRVAHGWRSSDIDRDIRRVLRETLAVYDIDLEALARVAPDVIVTQDLCDVCAVPFADVRAAVRQIAGPGIEIVDLHPRRLADIRSDLLRVARALGCEREAVAVWEELDARIEDVKRRSARIAERPAVLMIEWLDPVMIGGLWMPEMVALAGGQALVTRAGEPAITLTREGLARLAPDVVLVKPCGFSRARTLSEIDVVRQIFEGLEWPALRAGRVWIADGSAYFNRPGPRIVDSLEILAGVLQPRAFSDHLDRYQDAIALVDTGGPH